jgi:hypothetical protein
MAQMGYPEPSPGPVYEAACCGSTLQSLHRYHIDRCQCGKRAITGGGVQPRIFCAAGDNGQDAKLTTT